MQPGVVPYLSATGNIKVSSGTIRRIEGFQSKYVDARNVDIWVPDDYRYEKRYAVLYMHDGQMLFDAAVTWNHQAWEVDTTVGKLSKEGAIRDVIVVGIWNNNEYRYAEYFPQKVLNIIPRKTRNIIVQKQLKNKPQADNYLKFIVNELKPRIDQEYSTLKEKESTFIMGSSMGGLISIYALCEFPDIFGGMAGLSTHFPLAAYELIDKNTDTHVAAKFRYYLRAHLPEANTHKFYFDYGDQTLDSIYKPYQSAVDSIMHEKGYQPSFWQTREFPGESHTEECWSKRLSIPLIFLLNPAAPGM